MTPEKVVIRSRHKGYIDITPFEHWLIEIFLPELQRRREFHNYDGRAALILDNCSSHGTERFHTSSRENNGFLPFLPPYTSNQLQPLDLSLFGLTKRLFIRVD
jgi:hypothetical protein